MSTMPTYSAHPVSLPNDAVLTDAVALESLIAQFVPSPNSDLAPPTLSLASDGPSHPFVSAMLAPSAHTPSPAPIHKPLVGPNLTLTANMGITHLSSLSPLVDLFFELEKTVDPTRLVDLLEAAWAVSPDQTLKIIFHARSIARGKGERETFYRCCAWMGARHPRTLFESLPQLVNPLARKTPLESKGEGKDGEGKDKTGGDKKRKAEQVDGVVALDDDEEAVSGEEEDGELTTRSATSHGYYKDLLNLLSLSSASELNPYSTRIDSVLNPPATLRTSSPRPRKVSKTLRQSDLAPRKKWPLWTAEEQAAHAEREKQKSEEKAASAKELRKTTAIATHEAYVRRLSEDPFHRALHGAVTSLFATRLRADLALLNSNDPLERGKVSLAAKWAGSLGKSHDRATFIHTSLSLALIDVSELEETDQVYRTLKAQDVNAAMHHVRYLAHKRFIAPLRAHLDVVERKLSVPAEKAGEAANRVRFEKVPSLAMDRYKKLFGKREPERFVEYLQKVALGEAGISGRALTPATLVNQIRKGGPKVGDVDVVTLTVEGQWKTMIDDVKAGGGIGKALAVADVSGSMTWPEFKDGTCPMDSSIGLSLVLSELANPPFSNLILTFSADPTFVDVSGSSLAERVRKTQCAPSGMNTDFVKCFRLILDKAVVAKLPPSEMVDTIYVLSDMEFDQSQLAYTSSGEAPEKLETHYEEIKRMYEEKGYKLPALVFWNLAGGKSGLASKPVTAEEEGTVLVSGYSTGMIKAFLEGKVEDEEGLDEEDVEGDKAMLVDRNGEEVVTKEEEATDEEKRQEEKERKAKLSSLKVLKRAIGDESFAGLKVVD